MRGKISDKDYKRYYMVNPLKTFNPDHNKKVIQKTIEDHEKNEKRRRHDWLQQFGIRAQAIAFYLKHLVYGKTTPVEKYFGKKELKRLRAQRILMKLKRAYGANTSPIYTLEEI